MTKLSYIDLMLGDIIQINEMDEDDNIIQSGAGSIDGLDENGSLCGEDWYFTCINLDNKELAERFFISGLPITEDILKANGFEESKYETCKSVFCRVWGEWSFTMIKRSKGRWVAVLQGQYDSAKYGCECAYVRLNLFFVHDLQHAMRIAGLNEVANNFKIKNTI